MMVFSTNISEKGKHKKNDTIVYQIDTEKSRIDWSCDIHYGYVMLDKGFIAMCNNMIVGGKFEICMESIFDLDINDYELMKVTLENTLKSIEFFNTAKFHQSYFNIDHTITSDKSTQIVGELELLNIEQCISFEAVVQCQDNEITITSDTITIDRTHWGITSMSESDAKSHQSFIVPNEIDIFVHLVALRNDTHKKKRKSHR